jgi:replicative DNA helicase
MSRFAEVLDDQRLRDLAESDVYWDRIVSIEPLGMEQVYDLTIPGTHNFVANDVCVHNTALSLNAIWHASGEKKMPVAIFSLEMSKEQLVQRLISQTTRIPAQALRSGNVKAEDWPKLVRGVAEVSRAPIWIDDTAGVTLMEIRAKVRRLASQLNVAGEMPLSLVVVDYLQLMVGQGNRAENRQQEIAEISRGLKVLARDLDVPVLAIAQLSRAVEARHDKRPLLSDLRDCLPATALLTDADTGERLPIRKIVGEGLRPNVWAVDDDLRLVKRRVVDAWAVGRKELVEVELRSGLVLRCSEGHRLLSEKGWIKASDLAPGERVGLPRRQAQPICAVEDDPRKWLLCGWLLGDGYLNGTATLTTATAAEARYAAWLGKAVFGIRPVVKPERRSPLARKVFFTTGRMTGAKKNPMTRWLRHIDAWGHTGHRKRVPEAIWSRPDESVEAFLRGLFHADGSVSRSSGAPNVRLATISERLARDVQLLLLRLGVRASVHEHSTAASGYRPSASTAWVVYIGGLDNVRAFAQRIGFLGSKHAPLATCLKRHRRGTASALDRVPAIANSRVRDIKAERGISWTEVGWRDQGKLMSRERARELGDGLDDPLLRRLGNSDVLWEEVRAVRSAGREQAYDLTVEDVHNFTVDGFITHNSGAIEQDADMVMFLYRDEYYNSESDDKGIAEVIVGKHRNGPTGKVQLAWMEQYTKFASLARRV